MKSVIGCLHLKLSGELNVSPYWPNTLNLNQTL